MSLVAPTIEKRSDSLHIPPWASGFIAVGLLLSCAFALGMIFFTFKIPGPFFQQWQGSVQYPHRSRNRMRQHWTIPPLQQGVFTGKSHPYPDSFNTPFIATLHHPPPAYIPPPEYFDSPPIEKITIKAQKKKDRKNKRYPPIYSFDVDCFTPAPQASIKVPSHSQNISGNCLGLIIE